MCPSATSNFRFSLAAAIIRLHLQRPFITLQRLLEPAEFLQDQPAIVENGCNIGRLSDRKRLVVAGRASSRRPRSASMLPRL